MKKLYLIDASGFIYRSYFAIRNMTNAKGESTNALFGFIRSVLKLLKDFEPHHLAAVFDGPRNAQKRIAIYEHYKAHRAEMPADLRYQIDWARTFCQLAGIPMLNVADAEADDVMGSIAQWAAKQGAAIFLCTSDKDMCQLVNENIHILNTFKENQILDSKGVEDTYGVPPHQIVDWLAMVGDSSDNVPGLPGFGPKTAAELLKSFGSLDYILNHPTEIPGKKKQEILIQERDKALLSRQLVTLDVAVEIPHDPLFYSYSGPHVKELKEFYGAMNFQSLIREMGDMTAHGEAKIGTEEVEYQLVDTPEELEELMKILHKSSEVCFDTETTHLRPLLAELVGVGFCIEPKKAWYIPVNGKLGLETVLKAVKPLLEDSKIGFYGQNIKYDMHVMANYGIRIKNISFDTLLASYILNSHSRQHSLDSLALDYFGKIKIATSDLLGKGKKQITMREVPIEEVCRYCCEDVDYTCRLKQVLEKELHERKLMKLLMELELPLTRVLAGMERHGMYLDEPLIQTLAHHLKLEIESLQMEIYKLAGIEFNINSPLQLQKILFDKLQIPYPKRRSGSLSTGEDILELLVEAFPIAGKILEYRKLEKLRSTYVDILPQEIHPKDHRIHCTFNQSVAATGRLSCQDPNLQNIPVRTATGRKIREAFRPEKKGWSYLSADYSQIELRLLAHFSGDPYLIEAFKHNLDIHAHTAASVYGIPIESVTKEQRHAAKAVNFGLLYGQQAFGLSQELKISPKEAQEFIEIYFKRFTKVRGFLEECKEKARLTGKAVTATGRERLIPEIHNKNGMLRAQAERLAVNTPIQGTAADIIKKAMLQIDHLIQKHKKLGFMVLQIHDELIFEVPDFELVDFEPLVRNAMEHIEKLKVPLTVDIAVGKNWKEC